MEDNFFFYSDNMRVMKRNNSVSEKYNEEFFVVPDSVEEIYEYCFENSVNLKQVILPKNLKVLGYMAFKDCESLKEVKLPKGVVEIGPCCFSDCKSLKKVLMGDEVKKIGYSCFADCRSLESIKLSKKLERIEKLTFVHCEALKTVEISDNIEYIDDTAFLGCGNLEEIICSYTSYDRLLYFVRHNKDFFENINKYFSIINTSYEYKDKLVNFVFSGKRLTFFQKMKLKKILGDEVFEHVRFVERDNENEEEIDKESLENVHNLIDFGISDDEINKALNEIVAMSYKLPDSTRKLILQRLYSLTKDYLLKCKDYKPKFNDKSKVLNFKGSFETLKPRLLAELEFIKSSLYQEEILLKYISELGNYLKILNDDVKVADDSDKSLEGIIKKIVYYCSFFDEDRKEAIISKLNKLIQDELNKVSSTLNGLVDSSRKLTLDDGTKSKRQLHLSISYLLDEIAVYAERVKPFRELYNVLVSDKDVQKYKNGEDIVSLINGVRYVLNKMSSGKYKEFLNSQFSSILDKYKKIIEELFKDDSKLKSTFYEELEVDIRKDLSPILELIDKYAYADGYVTSKNNNSNLLNQLLLCLEIVNGKVVDEIEDEYKNQVITSSVIDVISLVYGNDCFNENDRNNVKDSLLVIINKYIRRLENDKIDDLDEYNDVLRKIVREIIALYVDAQIYVSSIQNYNKHVL